MTPILRHHLKIGLLTGLFFGFFMTAPDLYYDGNFSISKFLWYAIVFGITMTIMDNFMLRSNLEDVDITNPTDEDLKTNQQRVIHSEYTIDEIKSILVNQGLITDRSIRDTEEGFLATIVWTTASWGERFSIKKLQPLHAYEISSKPLASFLWLDNGKNLKNVIKIEKALAS